MSDKVDIVEILTCKNLSADLKNKVVSALHLALTREEWMEICNAVLASK